jgi:hypothetical protein
MSATAPPPDIGFNIPSAPPTIGLGVPVANVTSPVGGIAPPAGSGSAGSLIWFLLLTALNIGILTALFTVGNLEEIAKNWSRYRCNPIFMPFAASFGSDPVENFKFCLDSIFAGKLALIFGPLYGILNEFGMIISKIVNVAMGLRNLFSNMFDSVRDFLNNVKQKILTIMTQLRISFIKMNHLMGRVFGTLYAVIYMGISGLAGAQNMADNDLVQFLFEFCFAPDSPVPLFNGTVLPIHAIQIGDQLAALKDHTPVVTSKFVFDGYRTPMVMIGGLHLSAEHYVEGAPAEKHPSAEIAFSIPQLVCVNVTGHRFRIGPLEVSDYDESSDASVIKTTQSLAEYQLNGYSFVYPTEERVVKALEEYSLGVDGTASVLLENGEWKRLQDIRLGDCVQIGGHIVGTVEEQVEFGVTLPSGLTVSASQLLWTGLRWERAAVAYPTQIRPLRAKLYQLFTTNCSSFYVKYNEDVIIVREYREIADPVMENPYRESFE